MAERPQAVLRVEPHTIPALVTAFERALAELRPLLLDIDRRGRLPEPWLQDPVSIGVTNWYHWRVMGDGADLADSAYGKLRAYETELTRIREALVRAAELYRTTESGIADGMGRA